MYEKKCATVFNILRIFQINKKNAKMCNEKEKNDNFICEIYKQIFCAAIKFQYGLI